MLKLSDSDYLNETTVVQVHVKTSGVVAVNTIDGETYDFVGQKAEAILRWLKRETEPPLSAARLLEEADHGYLEVTNVERS
jgi:hypothetical protein